MLATRPNLCPRFVQPRRTHHTRECNLWAYVAACSCCWRQRQRVRTSWRTPCCGVQISPGVNSVPALRWDGYCPWWSNHPYSGATRPTTTKDNATASLATASSVAQHSTAQHSTLTEPSGLPDIVRGEVFLRRLWAMGPRAMDPVCTQCTHASAAGAYKQMPVLSTGNRCASREHTHKRRGAWYSCLHRRSFPRAAPRHMWCVVPRVAEVPSATLLSTRVGGNEAELASLSEARACYERRHGTESVVVDEAENIRSTRQHHVSSIDIRVRTHYRIGISNLANIAFSVFRFSGFVSTSSMPASRHRPSAAGSAMAVNATTD